MQGILQVNLSGIEFMILILYNAMEYQGCMCHIVLINCTTVPNDSYRTVMLLIANKKEPCIQLGSWVNTPQSESLLLAESSSLLCVWHFKLIKLAQK